MNDVNDAPLPDDEALEGAAPEVNYAEELLARDTEIADLKDRLLRQAAETENWATFIGLLASLNFFLGAFNLVPLLPLDGGHIAVTIYERIRNIFRNRRGLPDGAPVDYMKLMPVTYVVIIVFIGFSLLTLTADIVNPIQLF